MTDGRDAAQLLGAAGLMVDGPVVWGSPLRSRRPGVYLVELPEARAEAPIHFDALAAWIDRVPTLRLDGARPTAHQLADRLRGFWLGQQPVLYIGRSNASLGGRLAAFYATPLGARRPHAGGNWVRTLSSLTSLRIWWAETDAAEEYEDALRRRIESALADFDTVTLHSRAPHRTPTLLLTFADRSVADAYRFLAELDINAPADTFYAYEPARRLGLPDEGGLRIGLAPYNDDSDIERLLDGLTKFTG